MSTPTAAATGSSREAEDPIDVLVLGGTSWLGGEVARRALARGDEVTCLARGVAGSPPDGARWVRADRTDPAAYDEVAATGWDAVIDVSWQPDLVRSALDRLAPVARHWIYVSSCSVYRDDATAGMDESAPLHEAYARPGPVGIELYGPAKVACEQAVLATMGTERALLARAGLIGGYGDRSDRLGYWPARVARAGDGEPVLVPPRSAAVQVIDVADLAEWLVQAAHSRTAGTFNAVGDGVPLGELIEHCARLCGVRPRWREASDEWLVEHGVEPWAGPESLPLWLPQASYAGFMTRRNDAAHQAGLRLRPLADTLAAALRWEREVGLGRERSAGLTPGREEELLGLLVSGDDG